MSTNLELRNYQELILLQAKVSNTIAYLPTGTGKTLIACHLIKERLEDLRKKREAAKARASEHLPVIVFIAPTKALLNQQIDYIKTHAIPVQAHEFTGDSLYEGRTYRQIDSWGKDECKHQTTAYEVLGMTPKICVDCLTKRLFTASLIDLLILDECHHAVKNHPMSDLCDCIRDSEGEKPLIFGLTASPIDSKTKNLVEAIANLEEKLAGQFYYPSPEFLHLLQSFWKTPRMFLLKHDDSISSLKANEKNKDTALDQIELWIELSGKLEDVYIQEKQYRMQCGDLLSTEEKERNSSFFTKIIRSVSATGDLKDFKFTQLGDFKQVKEVIHQVIEVTKSSGLYCGIYALAYRLQINDDELAIKKYYRKKLLNESFKAIAASLIPASKVSANEESSDKAIEDAEIDSLLESIEVSVPESIFSKRLISIDLLPQKTEEIINCIGGRAELLKQFLNQPMLAFLSYHKLLRYFGASLFGENYKEKLKEIIQKRCDELSNKGEMVDYLMLLSQSFQTNDSVELQVNE